MKFRALIFGLLFLAGTLFSLPVFGAVSYSRTPAGYTIQSPVSFDVAIDDFESDTGCASWYNFWGVDVFNYLNEDFLSTFVSSSTLSFQPIFDLPPDTYVEVAFSCSLDGISLGNVADSLEVNGEEVIFEVVEAPAGGNIITLPEGFGAGFLAYAGVLFTDLSPLIAILFGVPLALWIVGQIIKLSKFFE